jgi:tRNA(Ile)-lysidine synthase
MLQKFRTFLAENGLVKPSVLLAVSGGIDSMVMAHLFLQTGCKTGIAHCNFGLRGSDSDLDEQLVSDFAGKKNLRFHSVRFQTTEYARRHSLSIQMAARELRYEWFEKIRSENGYDAVAVAHNLNDNIETLLINLVRGTGLTGLTGMKLISGNIIRPLLFATREEIAAYCSANGIVYREDRSNADTKYVRNRIRHLVIPVLKEINPAVEHTLNDTAARLTGINNIVTEYIEDLRKRICRTENGAHVFDVKGLKACLHNKAIIFELFRPFGITEATLGDLINITGGRSGSRITTGSHRIIRNREVLIVSPEQEINPGTWIITNPADFLIVPSVVSARSARVTPAFRIPAGRETTCIDLDKVSFPLTVRHWEAGDHFFPLGMDRKKKLSDFFTDLKYSAIDKEKALILESDGKIAAVLGKRTDNRFRLTESTKKALIIKTLKGRV